MSTFRANFPHLTTFHYSSFSNIWPPEADLAGLAHDGVTSLIWKGSLCLATLGASFPAVTRFKFEFRAPEYEEGAMASLWTTWPELQALHVEFTDRCGHQQLDNLLTGIPTQQFNNLKEILRFLGPKVTASELRELQGKFSRHSSISDAKRIVDLTVEAKYGYYHALTDIGGYFGLSLANKSLRVQLKGGGSKGRKEACVLSKKCLAQIAGNLGPIGGINW
jgi:hypothetical protein